MGNPPQRYGASRAIWDHTLLPAPATGECAPPYPQLYRPVLDLPTLERWKAELTLALVIHRDGLPVRRQSPIQVVTTVILQLDRASENLTLECLSQMY